MELLEQTLNFQKYKAVMQEVNKRAPKDIDVLEKIQFDNLFAVKQNIQDWLESRLDAIDVYLPDWTNYIRVLEDVMSDAHINSIITSVKNKVKGKEFGIYTNGVWNEEKTNMIKKPWFKKYLDYVVESIFYPYSLIFLGDYVNGELKLKLIPREYVTPQYNFIKQGLFIATRGTHGWDYTSPQMRPYYIFVPSHTKLGLIDVAAPHALGKKHMTIYWWRYAEIFGLPWRIGKTDMQDPSRKANMENAVKNAGNSMSMVIDKDGDEVEFLNSQGHDVYNLFKEYFSYANNEISKAFAGAIGIFDEKSFVGSAESGERIFDDYIQAYCSHIEDITRTELIPRLANTYNFPYTENDEFRFTYKQYISFKDKLATIQSLTPYYEFDDEEVSEAIGFKVQRKAVQENQVQTNDYPTKAKDNAKMFLSKNVQLSGKFMEIAGKLSSGYSLGKDEIEFIASQKKFESSYSKQNDDIGHSIWMCCGGGEGINWAIRKNKEIKGIPNSIMPEVHEIYSKVLPVGFPEKTADESENQFIQRFMSDKEMIKIYPNEDVRLTIAKQKAR